MKKVKKIEVEFKLETKEKDMVCRIEPDKTLADLLVMFVYAFKGYYPKEPSETFFNAYISNQGALARTDLPKSLKELKLDKKPYLTGVYVYLTDEGKLGVDKKLFSSISHFTLNNLLSLRHLMNYVAREGNITLAQALIKVKAHQQCLPSYEGIMASGETFPHYVITPLMEAAYYNRVDIVRTLLDHRGNINHLFQDLNALGFASHSLEDTTKVVFLLLAAGSTTYETDGNLVYLNSHPKVIELFGAVNIAPQKNKRNRICDLPKFGYGLAPISQTRLDTEDLKSSELALSSEQKHLFLNLATSLLVYLFSDSVPFVKEHWSIVFDYYLHSKKDSEKVIAFLLIAASSAQKESFLKRTSTYLLDEKRKEGNRWLVSLQKMLIRSNGPSFQYHCEYALSLAYVICQHVESYVARKGKSPEKECLTMLTEWVPQHWLDDAVDIGLRRFLNYNPLGKAIVLKEEKSNQSLFSLKAKDRLVVEVDDSKLSPLI